MKDVFVNNISGSNTMLLILINDNYKNFGLHYSNAIFE